MEWCQKIVKNFIQKYAQEECVEDSENIELVFDTERDVYLLLVTGWKDEKRIY
ncbi:MAG: element excision factor XisI family protein, partial [Dolichospermum sp.]